MQKTTKRLAAALLALGASAAMAQTTGMKYISTPGDYIGQGQTQVFQPPAATISAYDATTSVVHVGVNDPSNNWTLDFAAPSGVALAGTSFPDAMRYPFQSPLGAGLSMEGDGRGCNTLKGWFRVHEYVLDKSGNVKKLAVDFLQNCEVTMPPLYGVVRINSKFPLTIPETVAIAGRDVTVIAGQTATLDGTQSFTRKHSPLAYSWSQLDGPAVTLANPTSATPSFVAPNIDTATATLHFRLTTTDSAGDTSTDDVVAIVEGASAPRTSLDFRGDPGDYISGGQTWHYDTYNSSIVFSRNFDNGVSASVNGDAWWNFDSATPSGHTYHVGTFKNAQRYPFQSATAPGLSLYGDGRGCNTLTGQFTVYQIEFDTAGNPKTADITFTQHCEGGPAASYGELLLNAVPHATVAKQLKAARQQFPRQ